MPIAAENAALDAAAPAWQVVRMSQDPIAFADHAALLAWLDIHATTQAELWVLIWKKDSGVPSVTWDDCVRAALAHGWIDGIGKSIDEKSWKQRLTPRKPRGSWSARNVGIAGELIAEGRMRPAGLAQVTAAQADGRWQAAYAGPKDHAVPDDFLAAVASDPVAAATYAGLNRQNQFAIYYRLHTARTPETRARRMAKLLATLAAGQKIV